MITKHTPNDYSSFPNPAELLRYLRSGRILFPTAELALIWLNIRAAGIPPPKLIPEILDLTLTELWRDTRHRFKLGSSYPAAVIQDYFKPLGRILLTSAPRGVAASEPPRKYGDYTLRELVGPTPEETIQNWMRNADALTSVALPRITAGDPAFRLFWDDHYGLLLYSLYKWVTTRHISPHGVTVLTWLVVHLRHDTGGEWTFRRLMCIALRVFRDHPRRERETTGLLDELDDEPLCPDDISWQLHVPAYVQAALLSTLFDGTRLPHEVIAFFLRWHKDQAPREVVKEHAGLTLYELASEIHARFMPDADSPDHFVKELFASFDRRLALPFRGVTQNSRRLNNKRRLRARIVGFSPLRDFFQSRSAAERAKEVGHWANAVMKHLKEQAHQPGAPLNETITRWLGSPPGDENPLA